MGAALIGSLHKFAVGAEFAQKCGRDMLLSDVIAETQQRQEDEARARKAAELARLAAEAERAQADKLSWFKDPEGSLMPPAYPDS